MGYFALPQSVGWPKELDIAFFSKVENESKNKKLPEKEYINKYVLAIEQIVWAKATRGDPSEPKVLSKIYRDNLKVWFVLFHIVSKSHKKTITNNVFVCLSIFYDFPTLSVVLSLKPFTPAEDKML